MIAALKATIAHGAGDPGWARLRPPLVELSPAQSSALADELRSLRFEMPGLLEKAA
jgi:4-hydroxy-tetrahydrodipicolinate synthase